LRIKADPKGGKKKENMPLFDKTEAKSLEGMNSEEEHLTSQLQSPEFKP
jgi:hypothetical protein